MYLASRIRPARRFFVVPRRTGSGATPLGIRSEPRPACNLDDRTCDCRYDAGVSRVTRTRAVAVSDFESLHSNRNLLFSRTALDETSESHGS